MKVLVFVLAVVSSALSGNMDSCVSQPYNSSCSSYQIPDSALTGAIDSMCQQMNTMPVCTVYAICKNSAYSAGSYCTPSSIFKSMCMDMGSMNECANYTTMCPQGSLIKQCGTSVLPLPGSVDVEDDINSICKQMKMSGCDQCGAPTSGDMNCATLQVYSNLCKAMPGMSDCAEWKMMCAVVPDWPICTTSSTVGGGTDHIPLMQMYLHGGITDYVLFEKWVPQTNAQYFGTLLAVVIFGVISELMKLLKCFCDSRTLLPVPTSEPTNSNTFDITENIVQDDFRQRLRAPFRPKADFVRAGYRTLEAFWSIIVMLLVMTFNVGIIFAYCLGVFIGVLLVGRYVEVASPKPSSACC